MKKFKGGIFHAQLKLKMFFFKHTHMHKSALSKLLQVVVLVYRELD